MARMLLLSIAILLGVLTWAVVPGGDERCHVGVTVGTRFEGLVEIPCGLTAKEMLLYEEGHRGAPLRDAP